MKTFLKYLVFQLPGWTLWFVVLFFLISRDVLPLWSAWFFLLWVIKDFVLFPWVRAAYENNARTGIEKLIGLTAITQEALSPTGYVRINGELWRAEAYPRAGTIAQNTRVRVRDAHGLTLVVESEADETEA